MPRLLGMTGMVIGRLGQPALPDSCPFVSIRGYRRFRFSAVATLTLPNSTDQRFV
jgi:hypothetical protein